MIGSTKEPTVLRKIKRNKEIYQIIKNKLIVNYLKIQRLSCFANIIGITSERMIRKVYK